MAYNAIRGRVVHPPVGSGIGLYGVPYGSTYAHAPRTLHDTLLCALLLYTGDSMLWGYSERATQRCALCSAHGYLMHHVVDHYIHPHIPC